MMLAKGACHTRTPSGMVMTPAMIVAIHAVIRKTASIRIRATSGIKDITTVNQRCPVVLRICSNMGVVEAETRLAPHDRDGRAGILITQFRDEKRTRGRLKTKRARSMNFEPFGECSSFKPVDRDQGRSR